jgi:glyceraldehyde 3-phosphate dehydrogenase
VRIGINGLGRIGRGLLKILADDPRFELAAVNDVADPAVISHLLKHDSYYGAWNRGVASGDGQLTVEGAGIPFYHADTTDRIPWREAGIDVVVEATGRFKDRAGLEGHGLPVVLTAASIHADRMVVFGVNHHDIQPSDTILSATSCTTHCVAAPLSVLNARFGARAVLFNTVHCYNVSQTLVDAPQKDVRRARAAALNIIPTTTSASVAVEAVIPGLKGKTRGMAVRVPAPAVSLTELTVLTERAATREDVLRCLREAAEGHLAGILAVTEEELVSQDFVGNTASSIIDAGLAQVQDGLVRIIAWYDNEWGYINRLVDLLAYLREKKE